MPPTIPPPSAANNTQIGSQRFKSKSKAPPTYEKQLQECKWRNIAVPLLSMTSDMQQSIVQHRYPDRAGAHIEATGRDPRVFNAKVVFYNNTSRGKGETWTFGDLFPGTFKKFMDACADRSAGVLQHPVFGAVDVVCQHANFDLSADRRDGVIVDVSWIETIKNESEGKKDASKPAMTSAAAALDDALNGIPNEFKGQLPSNRPLSFLDLVDKVKAFIDTATLAGQKLLAQIDHVIYHLNNLLFSIRRINSVLLANLVQKIQALKAAMHTAKQEVNSSTLILTGSATYRVPTDTTIGALVQLLGNPVATLIKLNMKVAAKPVIPAGTIIKYAPGVVG